MLQQETINFIYCIIISTIAVLLITKVISDFLKDINNLHNRCSLISNRVDKLSDDMDTYCITEMTMDELFDRLRSEYEAVFDDIAEVKVRLYNIENRLPKSKSTKVVKKKTAKTTRKSK